MAWDPALLRKYNATGHFRLLKQVRAELKEQPIQRPLATNRPDPAARRSGRSAERSAELSRQRRPAVAPASAGEATDRLESSFDSFITVPVLTDAFTDALHQD